MKRIEVIMRFKDKTIKDFRTIGEIFEVSDERYEEIKSFCKVISDEVEITLEEVKKQRKIKW